MKRGWENVFLDFYRLPCNLGLVHSNSAAIITRSALILPSVSHFKDLVMTRGLSGKI